MCFHCHLELYNLTIKNHFNLNQNSIYIFILKKKHLTDFILKLKARFFKGLKRYILNQLNRSSWLIQARFQCLNWKNRLFSGILVSQSLAEGTSCWQGPARTYIHIFYKLIRTRIYSPDHVGVFTRDSLKRTHDPSGVAPR